jgi:hypothetical protein
MKLISKKKTLFQGPQCADLQLKSHVRVLLPCLVLPGQSEHRRHIEPGRGAFDTRERVEHMSVQPSDQSQSRRGRYTLVKHGLSIVAMVITATMGAHWSRRRTRTLHTLLHGHCLRAQ